MKLPDEQWPYLCYTSHDWVEVCDWCAANIGDFDRDWYKLGEDIMAQGIYSDYKSTYLFKREQDVVLFRLRWS